MAYDPLQALFAATPDPEARRRQLMAEQQKQFMAFSNPTQQLGFGLASIAGNMFRRFKTGEKDEGFINRLRTGNPDDPLVTQDAATQAAVTRGVTAAGGPRPGELPEEHSLRVVNSVYDSMMSEGTPDPKVLQQAAASRAALEMQAEEARRAFKDREQQMELRDIQLRTARENLQQSIMDGTTTHLVNINTGEWLQQFSPEDERLEAVRNAVNEDPNLALLTRKEALGLSADVRNAVLSNEKLDGPTERDYRKQAEASLAFNAAGQQVLSMLDNVDFSADVNTLGAGLKKFAVDTVTQIASLVPGYQERVASGTFGYVDTPDGVQKYETTFENVMRSKFGSDWYANSVWAGAMSKAEFMGLAKTLQYLSARDLDPSGRLSDFDVQVQADIMGTGLRDPAMMAAALSNRILNGSSRNISQLERHLEAFPTSPLAIQLRDLTTQRRNILDVGERLQTKFNATRSSLATQNPTNTTTRPGFLQRVTGAVNAITGADVPVPGEQPDDEFAGFSMK